MTTAPDPEYGELHQLVSRLDAVQAEMMTSDLRDLRIPAVMAQQVHEEIDPDTGERVTVDTGFFEVLVPDAFLEIATEVMGATYVKSEGPASTDEILADLVQTTPPVTIEDGIGPPSLLRRSERAGRFLIRALVTVISAVFLTMIWRNCAG